MTVTGFSSWVVQGGAVGMLGVVAFMIYLGRLVPRRHYDDIVRDRDQWRDVALKAIGQADALMPGAQIAAQMAEALTAAASRDGRAS